MIGQRLSGKTFACINWAQAGIQGLVGGFVGAIGGAVGAEALTVGAVAGATATQAGAYGAAHAAAFSGAAAIIINLGIPTDLGGFVP